MISLRTTVTGEYGPLLRRLVERLGPAGKAKLNDAAAHDLSVLVRAHVFEAAKTRHETADTIANGPAKRTGHLENAARSVSFTADSSAGVVTVSSPGFRRALGPLPIFPREKQWLTIPVDALAYGQTVAALEAAGYKIFRPGKKGAKKNVLAITENKTMRVLFALAKSATLKHDPGLLPEENRIKTAAREGVENYLRFVLQRTGT